MSFLVIATLGFFAWYLLVLYDFYRSGLFAYHDLGLINDFLRNTALGHPFWVSDLQFNHLGTHWTPALFLLVPFYWFCSSQFVLLVLGAAAVTVACALMAHLGTVMWADRCTYSKKYQPWFAVGFVAVFAGNMYSRSVVAAAHFEAFYMLACAVVVWSLYTGRPAWVIWSAVLVTLGVRQDAGLFLSLTLASMVFFPPPQDRLPRRQFYRWLAVVIPISCIYSVAIISFVMPHFGSPSTRQWAHLGSSWSEVMWNLLQHPSIVFTAVQEGAATQINRSFAWLTLGNPLVGLLNNLGGLIFYTANQHDKRMLSYYNASFFLPGLFFAYSAGTATLVSLLHRWHAQALMFLLTISLLVCGYRWCETSWYLEFKLTPDVPSAAGFGVVDEPPINQCASMAGDFNTYVFLPLNKPRYLLRRFYEADCVVMRKAPSSMLAGGFEDLYQNISNQGFQRVILEGHVPNLVET